ncbi:PTS sugar transporter subunit IIC [Candidatus Stoquefichus sp. SB1]|uniref:PTS sugar transporter subunit IIC n=1 Tax=Candidatus Stoquefichus sp. SB1 TaxID=1658109 RepID=UPI00067EB752|nr:PTS transporter subunit EIIC [Candidatus Stoquefichus sp. SB1]
MSLGDKLTEKLLIVASKISNQRHMSAIKNAFTALLPIIITGAFCTLFSNVVCSTTTTGISLAKLPGMSWLESLTGMFTAANYATLNFLTIGTVVLIAIELGKQLKHKEIVVPVIALASYISLCDTFTNVTVEGVEDLVNVANVIPKEFTNAQGLFLGMIVAMVSIEIYCRMADSGKLSIKMPDTVPTNVSQSFNVLFPGVLTILLISGFGLLFQNVFGISVYNAISACIQTPLRGVLTGLPGYLLIFGLSCVFWVIGIHGTQVLKPVYQATMLEAVVSNTDAVQNGQAPQFILNETFISCFTTMGGAGITIGLVIALLFASKRDDYKAIAKLSLAPGLFNINETMTFGLPIVLNPMFMIPFILTPILTASFAYIMTTIGFCGTMVYAVPWTTPPLLIAWLGSGGSIGAVITQAICIVISIAVYLPFVFVTNKQAKNEAEKLVQIEE